MQEKIRRKDKVEINMAVVEELLRHQNEVNHYLKNSKKYRCSLHPRKDLYPCLSCSKYDICQKNKKERDYIHNEQLSYTTSKRRMQKDDKEKLKSEILDSHEGKEKVYPCEPFDYCCPDKEKCNEGQNCFWKSNQK